MHIYSEVVPAKFNWTYVQAGVAKDGSVKLHCMLVLSPFIDCPVQSFMKQVVIILLLNKNPIRMKIESSYQIVASVGSCLRDASSRKRFM